MTYKFDPNLGDSVSLVRFHIGDNNSKGHFLEDETIAYFVTTYDWKRAVIECLGYIITQLSTPDFVEDWMEVSHEKARIGYEGILARKQKEFGIVLGVTISASSTVSLPTRADSFQTNNDYHELTYGEDEPDASLPF
jgi:hypothetical protein